MSLDELARAFQVTIHNPLLGLSGRLQLLHNLSGTLRARPDIFGTHGGLGNFYDYVERIAVAGTLPAGHLLTALLDTFAEASPNNAVEVVAMKAQLLISLERYDEGLELYEKAIEYRPENEGLVLGRAELLLRIGRLDEAIAEYQGAIKRWPESSMSLNALGYTLADRTDRYAEAEKLIRTALAKDPQSPAIIDSLGWVLYKLGRHEEGLKELQRAYERLDDAEVAAHLVEVLAELERHDEALELLESAEKLDPDSELLKNVRSRYFPASP